MVCINGMIMQSAALLSEKPAVHRYPGSMAGRVQQLCRYLVEHYDGDAEAIWRDADSGPELLRRLQELPGFGKQKAQIFVALLGKQLGVRPEGWRQAAGAYGEEGAYRSVADITGPESLARVRAFKQETKAAAKAAKAARSAQRMKTSRACRSRSVSASRQTPPFSVAPIRASVISDCQRRSWLMPSVATTAASVVAGRPEVDAPSRSFERVASGVEFMISLQKSEQVIIAVYLSQAIRFSPRSP